MIRSGQPRPIASLGHMLRLALVAGAILLASASDPRSEAEARPAREQAQRAQAPESRHRHSRRRAAPAAARHGQRGLASFYAPRFRGRPTARGEGFDPASDTAAHRTLPMGTVARVTNLANGRSAIVTIRDRGPHARGRIVDVSPRIADQLQMRQAGVVRVLLQPISVPPPSSRRRG